MLVCSLGGFAWGVGVSRQVFARGVGASHGGFALKIRSALTLCVCPSSSGGFLVRSEDLRGEPGGSLGGFAGSLEGFARGVGRFARGIRSGAWRFARGFRKGDSLAGFAQKMRSMEDSLGRFVQQLRSEDSFLRKKNFPRLRIVQDSKHNANKPANQQNH